MTVGFYSPLPPARTGVADYSAALIAALRRHGRVEVSPASCDVALYHLGNNPMHAAIYQRALECPGVVVLHDAVLHHFLLGQLDREAYIEEFAYNYGAWSRGFAAELWQRRAGSGADNRYFDFPMLKRIVERARAVVVHNPSAARAAQEHAPGTPVIELPFPLDAFSAPSDGTVTRYRQHLGIPADSFVFGVFGFLRESKRIPTVLEAFARLRAADPEVALLIAGSFASLDLERAIAPLLSLPGVFRLPYLSGPEFRLVACAVDACINLRYPSAGETSAIAIQLMGLGKPVLLTESEECSRFPEDAVIRIGIGEEERESLASHMVLLTSLPGVVRAIGQRGFWHVQEHHQVERVAQRYWEILCAFRS